MRIPLRARSIALAVSLACGGFAIACPQWSHDIGLDVWSHWSDGDDPFPDTRNPHELDCVNERVKKRIELKQYIVRDLIGGRMELEEATEQFQALNQVEPDLTSIIRMHFEGADDREKTARQVIGFARTSLQPDPSHQEFVVKRLELRLQMMKGQRPAELVH